MIMDIAWQNIVKETSAQARKTSSIYDIYLLFMINCLLYHKWDDWLRLIPLNRASCWIVRDIN